MRTQEDRQQGRQQGERREFASLSWEEGPSLFLSYRRDTGAARSPPTFFHVRTLFDTYSFLFIRVYIPFSPAFTALSSFATNAYPGLRTANFFQLGGGAGRQQVRSATAYSTLTPAGSLASNPASHGVSRARFAFRRHDARVQHNARHPVLPREIVHSACPLHLTETNLRSGRITEKDASSPRRKGRPV